MKVATFFLLCSELEETPKQISTEHRGLCQISSLQSQEQWKVFKYFTHKKCGYHCFSWPFLKLITGLSWMKSCPNTVECLYFLNHVQRSDSGIRLEKEPGLCLTFLLHYILWHLHSLQSKEKTYQFSPLLYFLFNTQLSPCE